METAAVNLFEALAGIRDVTLIKTGWSNKLLPLSLVVLFARGLVAALSRATSVIIMQDGVLAPMGRVLGFISRKPVVVIIHGLEVTHTGAVHRALMRWSLPHVDLLVAVSDNTRQLIDVRFPGARTVVVPNGVRDDFWRDVQRSALDAVVGRLAGMPVERVAASTVLVTVGRLVARKGVRWFVGQVMPSLPDRFIYLVVGSGGEKTAIEAEIAANGLGDRVIMLGGIDRDDLLAIYNRADTFVMPNIPVENDVEGFGLVALEASSTGTPVVAADIDGIPDAVRSPGNGVLVAAHDTTGFLTAIQSVDASPAARAAVRDFTLTAYSWESSARALDKHLTALTAPI